MYERVIENWLTRVNERTLEIPFCQLLATEGYEVVHMSRHGSFEQGKDILALAPDGTPCAFQIMSFTGKITLRAWQEYLPQIQRLVEVPITHPSIPQTPYHRAYLVMNGELEEEVRLEIADRNRGWEGRGFPALQTIVRGQLLVRFKDMQTNLWPVPLSTEKTLLEFFLSNGTACLDKGALAAFLLDLLPVMKEDISAVEISRELASAAICTAYALSPYAEKNNHVAVIEGWLVYIASLIALIERHRVDERYWRDSLSISMFAVEQSLIDLCEELQVRPHLVEGNSLVDAPFYRGRVTWLAGLVAAFALWKRVQDPKWVIEDWFKDFVASNRQFLSLWGEAAVPQFLAIIWFLRCTTASREPDQLLSNLIDALCLLNVDNRRSNGLPNPYKDLGAVVEELYGITNRTDPENYRGRSYSLESLLHLFVRRNWRQPMRFFWPRITHIQFAEFEVEAAWQFCLWQCDEAGILRITSPSTPQGWAELRKQANEVDVSTIPLILQERPELLLLFVIAYPHRLTKNVAKFLDDQLRRTKT